MSRLRDRVFPRQTKSAARSQLPYADGSPGSIYTGGSIGQRLETIQHHLRFADSAAIICAPEGSGKTTLLHQIIEAPTGDFICIHLQAGPDLTPPEIESAMLGASEPVAQSVSELMRGAKRAARLVLIAVDDAEALTPDALHQLALWQSSYGGQGGALRLLLLTSDHAVGQRLSTVISTETFTLPPLSPEESHNYLAHRWRALLPDEPFPFSAEDIAAIHQLAGGVPQSLNSVAARRVVASTSPAQQRKPNRPLLTIASGAVVIALLAALASLLFTPPETPSQLQRKPIPLPGKTAPAGTSVSSVPKPDSAPRPTMPPLPVATEPVQRSDAPTAIQRSPLSELLAQPDESYTLQLVGSSSESAVQQFLDEHRLNRALYFRSTRDNQAWFTAVLGVYADRQAADAALAKLPEAVRNIPPWPRRIGDIKPIADPP